MQVIVKNQAHAEIMPLVNSACNDTVSMQWLVDLAEKYRSVLRQGRFYQSLATATTPAELQGWVRQLYYMSSEFISSLALRSQLCPDPRFTPGFTQHSQEESEHPEQLITWMRQHSFLGLDEAPTSVPASLETVALTAYLFHSVLRKPVPHQLIALNLVSEGVAFDFYSQVIPKLTELGLENGLYWQVHTELDQDHLTMDLDLIPACTPGSPEGQAYAHTLWETFSLYSQMLDSWSGLARKPLEILS